MASCGSRPIPGLRRALMAAALLLLGVGSALAATDVKKDSKDAKQDPGQTAAASVGINALSLGLVINDNDPLSVEIGEYYQQRRGIPRQNVFHVRFPTVPALSRSEFMRVWSALQPQLSRSIQAFALAWTLPYRVDCMSITSAFAYGFDAKYCAEGCRPTPFSPYFDATDRAPFDQFGFRPTMMLAARDLSQARALIDRGVASDGTAPKGTAYLLDTSDRNRNARAGSFGFARGLAGNGLDVQVVKSDALRGRSDVLFYFTGVMRVAELRTNKFLPGALADHLTSAGGVLSGSDQMTSLEWLEAGATASYGTVVEPCNFPGKFPNIAVVIRHYLEGDTAIESYWKSVLMPSQGLFVGEPLATPYRGSQWTGISQARQAHVSARE